MLRPFQPTYLKGFMRSGRRREHRLFLLLAAGVVLSCDDNTRPPPPGDSSECVPGHNEFDFPMHHQHPAWSRQGLVAFQDAGIVMVDSSGVYDTDSSLAGLWVLNPTTGVRRRITPYGRAPTWSPDGTKIAFSVGQIFTVNPDGTALRQLTFLGAHHFPSWSPSGDLIAYDDAQHLWIMRGDGTNPQNIGLVEQPQGSRMPSWNPNGTKIVYIGYVDATFPTSRAEVFVMDASGTNAVRITTNETDDTFPVFSPDGRSIAYSGQFLDGTIPDYLLPQIWVVSADGGGVRQLTAHGGYHPSWSSNGLMIVYTRENAICDIPGNGVLWTVDLRTGVETQLTTKWPEQSLQ